MNGGAVGHSTGMTDHQVLLLKAAIHRGPGSITAWSRWRAEVDLETIDRGSSRLLPLLWHNLLTQGVSDPLMPRLRGIYRHTWFANQARMAKLGSVQRALADDDIDIIVLKGAALAHAFYSNPGLRPMDDLDILIRPARVADAVEVLQKLGWSAPIPDPVNHLLVVNGTEFLDPNDDRLDLHAHLLPVGLRSDRDAPRWRRSVAIDAGGIRFRVLDPTDQLLQVVVHGALSNPPAIRWVADAMALLEHPNTTVDWVRLAGDAEEEGYEPILARQLDLLAELFDAPIPRVVLARASHRPLGARVAHRLATGPQVFLVGGLLQRWFEYRRWKRGPNRGEVGFPRYLQLLWDVGDRRQMARQTVRRAIRRLRNDVFQHGFGAQNSARDA